jgi:hypothetical protein
MDQDRIQRSFAPRRSRASPERPACRSIPYCFGRRRYRICGFAFISPLTGIAVAADYWVSFNCGVAIRPAAPAFRSAWRVSTANVAFGGKTCTAFGGKTLARKSTGCCKPATAFRKR